MGFGAFRVLGFRGSGFEPFSGLMLPAASREACALTSQTVCLVWEFPKIRGPYYSTPKK